MILSPGPVIDVEALPENVRSGRVPSDADDRTLTLEDVERRHILRILESVGWNQTVAARRLGLNRGTLNRKLKQWEGGRDLPETA